MVNKRRPIKRDLDLEEQTLVKESLVRTLTWKMWKYQDAADMEKTRKLQKDVRDWKKRYTREFQERLELHRTMQMYRRLTGIDIEEYVNKYKKETGNATGSNINERWIPCDVTLPEEKINPVTMDYYEYEVTFQSGDFSDIRHYKFGDGHWWNGPGQMDKYVTAWKQRPEPYRKD